MRRTLNRLIPATLLAALAACLMPVAAGADDLLDETLTLPTSGATTCAAKPAAGAGVLQRRVALPAPGVVGAKLTAASGDWDVAVFEARNGRLVTSGAAYGANEVAVGFVRVPGELIVQACRRKGTSRTARLTVTNIPLRSDEAPVKASLLKVHTPTRADKGRLQALNVDLTEHAGHDYVAVVA